jgi:hypothetical protein
MAFRNLIANRILTAAANLLYGARLTDEATGYKAFRATVLDGMALTCRGFEFCPEVTAKIRRLGYKIHEVPISYNARGIAEGKKIRARHGFEALWTLIKYRFTPRRRFTARARGLALGVAGSEALTAISLCLTSGMRAGRTSPVFNCGNPLETDLSGSEQRHPFHHGTVTSRVLSHIINQ